MARRWITVPVVGTGKEDDPRRPDLPEGVEFVVGHDGGDFMLVQVAGTQSAVDTAAFREGALRPRSDRIVNEAKRLGAADTWREGGFFIGMPAD